jgi:hypothetical protein
VKQSHNRDRLLVALARAGEFTAHGDPLRQLGQDERNPEPFAECPELGERHLKVRVRVPPALAEHDPRLAKVQPGQRAYPRILGVQQQLERGQERVRCLQPSSVRTFNGPSIPICT